MFLGFFLLFVDSTQADNKIIPGKISRFKATTKKGNLVNATISGDMAKEFYTNLKLEEHPLFGNGTKSFEKKGSAVGCIRSEKNNSTEYSCSFHIDQTG